MPVSPSKRVEAFTSWLIEQVDLVPENTRLSTERELAAVSGISPSTVKRVLNRLARQGKIYRIRGKGSFTGSGSMPPRATLPVAESSAMRLARHIEQLIADGTFKRGNPLPSFTHMKQHFRVGAEVIAEAKRLLERRGLIYKIGRAYRVGRFEELAQATTKKTVYLVRLADPQFMETQMYYSYIKMEQELHRCGYCLRIISEDQFRRHMHSSRPAIPEPYGYILHCFFSKKSLDAIRTLLERGLKKGHRPRVPMVAVFSGFKLRESRIITINTGHVGTITARTCARFMHTRRMYKPVLIAPRQSPPFIFERMLKIVPEICNLNHETQWTIAIEGKRPAGADDYPKAAGARATWDQLDMILAKYGPIPRKEVIARFSFFASLTDIFEAYRDGHVWICGTPEAAATAYSWCRNTRISMPEKVALLSLADNARSFADEISACIPDYDTIGYQIAHAIIGDLPVSLSRSGSLEMKAMVLERSTT